MRATVIWGRRHHSLVAATRQQRSMRPLVSSERSIGGGRNGRVNRAAVQLVVPYRVIADRFDDDLPADRWKNRSTHRMHMHGHGHPRGPWPRHKSCALVSFPQPPLELAMAIKPSRSAMDGSSCSIQLGGEHCNPINPKIFLLRDGESKLARSLPQRAGEVRTATAHWAHSDPCCRAATGDDESRERSSSRTAVAACATVAVVTNKLINSVAA